MTKDEAARTAGARLQSIERWSRATFAAAAVSAALLALIAAGGAVIMADYLRLKWAAAEAVHRIEERR